MYRLLPEILRLKTFISAQSAQGFEQSQVAVDGYTRDIIVASLNNVEINRK